MEEERRRNFVVGFAWMNKECVLSVMGIIDNCGDAKLLSKLSNIVALLKLYGVMKLLLLRPS